MNAAPVGPGCRVYEADEVDAYLAQTAVRTRALEAALRDAEVRAKEAERRGVVEADQVRRAALDAARAEAAEQAEIILAQARAEAAAIVAEARQLARELLDQARQELAAEVAAFDARLAAEAGRAGPSVAPFVVPGAWEPERSLPGPSPAAIAVPPVPAVPTVRILDAPPSRSATNRPIAKPTTP